MESTQTMIGAAKTAAPRGVAVPQAEHHRRASGAADSSHGECDGPVHVSVARDQGERGRDLGWCRLPVAHRYMRIEGELGFIDAEEQPDGYILIEGQQWPVMLDGDDVTSCDVAASH